MGAFETEWFPYIKIATDEASWNLRGINGGKWKKKGIEYLAILSCINTKRD
jgi:hypothetical protein